MKKLIQPYHFTKNINENFVDFFEKVTSFNGIVCFDFEDSIRSVNLIQMNDFKNCHRKSIIEGLRDISSKINLNKIGFRINGINSQNYNEDIEDICILESINCVFLPKVENHNQVEKLLEDIPQSVKEIIPIIETKKGFENIEEILSIKNSRFSRVAFGHCDYNLNNQYFPFFHQDTQVFWEWISNLDQIAYVSNKQLINSPVLCLNDDVFFSQILLKNSLYSSITGQITLCLKQTFLCNNYDHCAELIPINVTINNNYEIAVDIIKKFEKYKIEDRFFALDENRVLISPQEYMLAKKVVKIVER